MKDNLTEIVFIIDKSGSMSGLESETIGGFNAMLAKQRKEEGEAIVFTVFFDDEAFIVHDRIAIENVNKLTNEDYYAASIAEAFYHVSDICKEEALSRIEQDMRQVYEQFVMKCNL